MAVQAWSTGTGSNTFGATTSSAAQMSRSLAFSPGQVSDAVCGAAFSLACTLNSSSLTSSSSGVSEPQAVIVTTRAPSTSETYRRLRVDDLGMTPLPVDLTSPSLGDDVDVSPMTVPEKATEL